MWKLVLVCLLCVVFVPSVLMGGEWYIGGHGPLAGSWSVGIGSRSTVVYPSYYTTTPVYVYPNAVYVEPVPTYYLHPGHYEYWYDFNGVRWERWVSSHYGTQPYKY